MPFPKTESSKTSLESIKCLISFSCGGCRIVHLSSLRHIALKLVAQLHGSYGCMPSLVKINVLCCSSLPLPVWILKLYCRFDHK